MIMSWARGNQSSQRTYFLGVGYTRRWFSLEELLADVEVRLLPLMGVGP